MDYRCWDWEHNLSFVGGSTFDFLHLFRHVQVSHGRTSGHFCHLLPELHREAHHVEAGCGKEGRG